METQNKKNGLRSLIATGLLGLAGLANQANAQITNGAPVKTSGDIAYFAANETKSAAPNSYAEINHNTKLPHGMSVGGFIDFYRDGQGYFGKTVVEKGLTEKLNLRAHIMHGNAPLTQEGLGLSYVLPTPKGTFAKVSYLPYFADTKGEQVDNKQIAAYYASVGLPFNSKLFSFGEINVDGKNGPEWAYGEVEVAKKFGRFSVGLNLQLNNDGAGKLTPEVITRFAVRREW